MRLKNFYFWFLACSLVVNFSANAEDCPKSFSPALRRIISGDLIRSLGGTGDAPILAKITFQDDFARTPENAPARQFANRGIKNFYADSSVQGQYTFYVQGLPDQISDLLKFYDAVGSQTTSQLIAAEHFPDEPFLMTLNVSEPSMADSLAEKIVAMGGEIIQIFPFGVISFKISMTKLLEVYSLKSAGADEINVDLPQDMLNLPSIDGPTDGPM